MPHDEPNEGKPGFPGFITGAPLDKVQIEFLAEAVRRNLTEKDLDFKRMPKTEIRRFIFLVIENAMHSEFFPRS